MNQIQVKVKVIPATISQKDELSDRVYLRFYAPLHGKLAVYVGVYAIA